MKGVCEETVRLHPPESVLPGISQFHQVCESELVLDLTALTLELLHIRDVEHWQERDKHSALRWVI